MVLIILHLIARRYKVIYVIESYILVTNLDFCFNSFLVKFETCLVLINKRMIKNLKAHNHHKYTKNHVRRRLR